MSHPDLIEPAPRRGRAKNKKALVAAAELEQRLTALRAEFDSPALRELLDAAIAGAHRVATGSRKGDRDAVFYAIDIRGCRTMAEIREDTGLTRKTIKPILDEFVNSDYVEMRESKDVESTSGRPEIEYWPRQTRADSPFLSVFRSANRK